ncbi:hypothetical protein IMZ11_12720 [Microtetraspora sp. AC03309]|uniref:hypothetical protein n=1 Tax=Microtetraspora sp. AC03309 TaxID=2779376 RepID=UPI001E647036|nr:hypothetical protein [Microtetraspora sp. AC03309]MCC5576495.1 hypothetical protein [Microtetraspora sp. AC03309]
MILWKILQPRPRFLQRADCVLLLSPVFDTCCTPRWMVGLLIETEMFLLHLPLPVRTMGPWSSAIVVTQAAGRIAVAFAPSCGHATAPNIATAVTANAGAQILRPELACVSPTRRRIISSHTCLSFIGTTETFFSGIGDVSLFTPGPGTDHARDDLKTGMITVPFHDDEIRPDTE